MFGLLTDTHGLFNLLIPGTSFFSGIENSSWLVSKFSDVTSNNLPLPPGWATTNYDFNVKANVI